MNNEEFREERKETLIGKLMSGTRYEDYALKNQILDKNSDFIEKKTGSAKFSFTFIFKGNYYGVWNDYKNGKVYVSEDYVKDTYHIFALTLDDFKPNVLMIKSLKKYAFFKNFIDNFSAGIVYFENQKIKHNTYEAIKIYKSY